MSRSIPAVPAELMSVVHHYEQPAILLSRDYEILAANRAYHESFGTGVTGRFCHAVSHHYAEPCDRHGEDCPLAQCLATGRTARALHVHHTRHGPEHVDVRLHPIRGEDGEILAFIETMRKVVTASTRTGGAALVGQSRTFNRVIGLVERVAPRDVPVLLLGESGTGKELTARAVHAASGRTSGPFVPVACSGLSESLFESELFGHEKGAFTGAHARRIGLVEGAEGGTLFLDEIGDVPLSMQVKLLRLLESRAFRRVGGNQPIEANFRLICATHRDLETLVSEGRFRQDLYFRINTFPIELPPLRERLDDIPLLVRHFLAEDGVTKRVTDLALRALQQHGYPGNLRELRNLVRRAEILADGDVIDVEHLPASLTGGPRTGPAPTTAPVSLEEVERRYLREVARDFTGSRAELARTLGISERTLYRKLERALQEE